METLFIILIIAALIFAIVKTTRRYHAYQLIKQIRSNDALSVSAKHERIQIVKDYFDIK